MNYDDQIGVEFSKRMILDGELISFAGKVVAMRFAKGYIPGEVLKGDQLLYHVAYSDGDKEEITYDQLEVSSI